MLSSEGTASTTCEDYIYLYPYLTTLFMINKDNNITEKPIVKRYGELIW